MTDQRRQSVRRRTGLSLGLGAVSIGACLVLALTDGVDASVSWTHHAGVSAAPLLLVAGALVAVSISHPPRRWASMVMRLVTVAAFSAWGLSQLFPGEGVGTALDDAAIVLFVIDAGVLVISDSRRHGRQKTTGPETTTRNTAASGPPGTTPVESSAAAGRATGH
jgi:cation transport ATPase